MSKVANMLNMVRVLSDGKVRNTKELSKEVEVSDRMIRVYKDELEQAGIYIETIRGKYGGYKLDKLANIIDIGLTKEEIDLLNKTNNYLNVKKDFSYKLEIYKITEKINSAYIKNVNRNDITKLTNIEDANLKEIYRDIRLAINSRTKVLIEYRSIISGITKRKIHPAELFNYINDWYLAAFCELRSEIRLFKLSDILEYSVLNENFSSVRIQK